ncbi:MAG: acyltransferase [Cohaesibacteraceae bacterium]|nr:acyltransferase [Cohaesibacteraceae bacterium]MBL4875267.1 acyltransferase [Cohaesibacteraceae bacterium]
MKTVADYSLGRDNNFNLIRFLAAFAVVVTHSASIVHGDGARELLYVETGYSLGHHAVNVFFVVSGFLIAQSFIRSRDIIDYVCARILRLIPGLVVAAFVTAFIIGPLVTTVSLGTYFQSLSTWLYVPLVGSVMAENTLILNGVFSAAPFSGEINTPLWTLRWEALAYMGVAVLGLAGLLQSRWRFGAVLLMFTGIYLGISVFTELRTQYDAVDHVLRFSYCYLTGTGFYIYRKYIPLNFVLAISSWVATVLLNDTVFYQLMLIFSLGYTAFWLAYIPRGSIHQFNKIGDFSYGIYIYGFPLSQLVILAFPDIGQVGNVLIATPAIIATAALSYYYVEAPMMKIRHRIAQFIRRSVGSGFKLDAS